MGVKGRRGTRQGAADPGGQRRILAGHGESKRDAGGPCRWASREHAGAAGPDLAAVRLTARRCASAGTEMGHDGLGGLLLFLIFLFY